jgi:hypothetical protein
MARRACNAAQLPIVDGMHAGAAKEDAGRGFTSFTHFFFLCSCCMLCARLTVVWQPGKKVVSTKKTATPAPKVAKAAGKAGAVDKKKK